MNQPMVCNVVSNRFLEMNGVYKKPSPPPSPERAAVGTVRSAPVPPPAPAPRPSITRSASFLQANGVGAPLNRLAVGVANTQPPAAAPALVNTSAVLPAPRLSSTYFLGINGALAQPTPPPAPLNDVDQAVVSLEAAIVQQNSVDPFARRFFQDNVNSARDELEGAIRNEIDATQTAAPYFVPVTLDQKRETGADIVDRHSDNDAVSLEVERAVDDVIVDVEVDDTVDFVSRAPDASRGYDRLAGRLDDVSQEPNCGCCKVMRSALSLTMSSPRPRPP